MYIHTYSTYICTYSIYICTRGKLGWKWVRRDLGRCTWRGRGQYGVACLGEMEGLLAGVVGSRGGGSVVHRGGHGGSKRQSTYNNIVLLPEPLQTFKGNNPVWDGLGWTRIQSLHTCSTNVHSPLLLPTTHSLRLLAPPTERDLRTRGGTTPSFVCVCVCVGCNIPGHAID